MTRGLGVTPCRAVWPGLLPPSSSERMIAAYKVGLLSGFGTKSPIPAARQAATSSGKTLAVIAMMGESRHGPEPPRIARVASPQSIHLRHAHIHANDIVWGLAGEFDRAPPIARDIDGDRHGFQQTRADKLVGEIVLSPRRAAESRQTRSVSRHPQTRMRGPHWPPRQLWR